MDSPAIVAAWAAVIAAIVGPLVSAYVTNSVIRFENRRQEAVRLFRQVSEHSQDYLHAFVEAYDRREAFLLKLRELHDVEAPLHMPTTYGDCPVERQKNEVERLKAEIPALELADRNTFRKLQGVVSILNADVLSLGLLFEQDSKGAGVAIRRLIVMGDVLNRDRLEDFDSCQAEIHRRIDAIMKELKPLFDSLVKSDMMRDTYGDALDSYKAKA